MSAIALFLLYLRSSVGIQQNGLVLVSVFVRVEAGVVSYNHHHNWNTKQFRLLKKLPPKILSLPPTPHPTGLFPIL